MMSDTVDILGISYRTGDAKEVLDRMREAIRTRTRLAIVQPHFFHAVLGRSDHEAFELYSKYDLILPDGYGMYIAAKLLHGGKRAFAKIFNGTDLYEQILNEANLHHWRIFFFGETEDVLEALRRRMHDTFPGVVVAGTHHGFVDLDDKTAVAAVKKGNADILMIGMGTPKQDRWLWKYAGELQTPVLMTVGAGIGFMSGEKIRAPRALRKLHMEWLFRFTQEPRRLWRRYFFGIPKFIFYVVLQKVRRK